MTKTLPKRKKSYAVNVNFGGGFFRSKIAISKTLHFKLAVAAISSWRWMTGWLAFSLSPFLYKLRYSSAVGTPSIFFTRGVEIGFYWVTSCQKREKNSRENNVFWASEGEMEGKEKQLHRSREEEEEGDGSNSPSLSSFLPVIAMKERLNILLSKNGVFLLFKYTTLDEKGRTLTRWWQTNKSCLTFSRVYFILFISFLHACMHVCRPVCSHSLSFLSLLAFKWNEIKLK